MTTRRTRILAAAAAVAIAAAVAGSALVVSRPDSTTRASVPAAENTSTSTTGTKDTTDDAPGTADPTATPDETVDVEAAGTSGPGADTPATPDAGGVEVVPGAGGPPPAPSDSILGELDDAGLVPAGLDFTAPPQPVGGAHDFGGPGGLAVAPSCSHRCITSGIAYARGFGAELVVETDVPAELFITAVADPDGDGDYQESHVESTPFGLTAHAWALDHLLPGVTYHAMVAATDGDGHTDYAWGEFTTLSTRDVFVEIGDTTVYGGPGNIETTTMWLGLGGPIGNVTPGQQGILLYKDLPRYLDAEFWVARHWNDEVCEGWAPGYGQSPHGHDSGQCIAWNSASIDGVDLDTIPAGPTRWTQTSVELWFQPPTGEGDALPPGFGDPYYFSFGTPVTLHVSYS